MRKNLNKRKYEIKIMHTNKSNLDILSMVFFIAGAFIVVSDTLNTNLGWVLMVIGIVKQLLEWKE